MGNPRLQEKIDRLQEIKGEMKELLGEAYELLRDTKEFEHARCYWIAHITCSLDGDHQYLDRSATMQDSIDVLLEARDEDAPEPAAQGSSDPA
jgi:hypothetical protein